MKKTSIMKYCFILFMIISGRNLYAQNPENWTNKELMTPANLAEVLKANKDVPVIFSVGPAALIPNSIDIGMVSDEKNLDKLKNK